MIRRRLLQSARALLAHRTRAALTLSSVAIGVAAVVVTSAIGQGVNDGILRDVEAMGTGLLVVRPGKVERSVARPGISGRVTSLRLGDCDAIGELDSVREVAPGADGRMRVKAGRGSMEVLIMGTSSSFQVVRALSLQSGRFLLPAENAASLRVAVLGARVAATLFPDSDPVGEAIRIRGLPFQVIGVLAARGVLADGANEDSNIFVPIRTAMRRLFNTTWLSSVFISAADPAQMHRAEEEIRALLRKRHRLPTAAADDFDVQNQAKLLASRRRVADSLTLLSAALAGVSLLIGGTGVLALMLLSVAERTTEIGLRMAVGARPADVFLQFLLEASVLAFGGWAIGALLGCATALTVGWVTSWPVGAPRVGLVASLAVTLITGLVFGSLPARNAAMLPPIRALRSS